MEDYLGRVHGLRIAAGDLLPAEALTDVDSLIEHGEPAEGVCSLAWALHNADVASPPWVNEAILDLTNELIDPAHMPPPLRVSTG
jgi:hypothetical protein